MGHMYYMNTSVLKIYVHCLLLYKWFYSIENFFLYQLSLKKTFKVHIIHRVHKILRTYSHVHIVLKTQKDCLNQGMNLDNHRF